MTQFSILTQPILTTTAEAIIVPLPVSKGSFPNSKPFHSIDDALGKALTDLYNRKIFTGKKNEIHAVHTLGKLNSRVVICVGVGETKTLTPEVLRHAAGVASRKLQELRATSAVWLLETLPTPEKWVQALVEGTFMGSYEYTDCRSSVETTREGLKSLEFALPKASTAATAALRSGGIVGQAVNTARTLANTPANLLTPTHVLDWAKDQFKKSSGVTLEVIDAKKAKSLGMGLFLGVAQGSVEPPYMLVMRYLPVKGQKPVALVGKGVTFDSGGISIKPAAKMSDMKGDMSGAAAVLATMVAVTQLKPKKNIIAIVGLTENMPSGTAYRPSDVLTAMNGKTVEITNTDAEGRLVLGDALCYVVKEGAKEIVDLATLTGACSVALGDVAAAILGNDQALVDRWLDISTTTGERLWQLPLYEEYLDYLKSDTADLVNASEGRLAGTCTGGKFLEQFVNGTPWVHLDIASMMHYSSTSGYVVKGMSGVGVRNLVGYILGPANAVVRQKKSTRKGTK